jgi:N-methylhydantoinase A
MSVIGIDTGGTFCDLVLIDDDGRPSVHKSPSTPSENSEGVFNVLDVAQSSIADKDLYAEVNSLALGTTIATNTVVTHTGSKIGLITTRGHGDMLAIMRVNGRVAGRPLGEIQNYSVTDKPAPIVPKALIVELDERIDAEGEVIVPLSIEQVEAAVDKLVDVGVKAIAVSLLWGFLNPAHEKAVAEVIAARHPHVFVSLASDLSRRLGEYERTEAAVVNGYVAATVQSYLDKVSNGLRTRGLGSLPYIMHTAGGVGTEASARNRPITTLFSGPAGGIVASKKVCEAAGYDNVICADVGGTTFDVGLIVNGRATLRNTTVIDQRVMYCSTIDVVSIGAGGGSIASVDPVTKRLLVGPQSAGSQPGPACYGRGGRSPTVTDANLIIG